ncbi:unnamed protein product [Ilex paraguariensis]|uniref:Equilibrative nucleotide transporter 8 n=1 Tax=Ilex paraguariensis TaxID=185542 RepID=A0ABC8RA23_9AQUA
MQKTQGMESVKATNNQTEPKDTYRLAYIIHFLLGAGNLLPWNALITAIDYFNNLYPTKHIEKVFSVTYMGSSVSMLLLILIMSWGRKMSFRVRMNLGFSLFVFSLMVSPIIDWGWRGDRSKGGSSVAYGILVGAVVICGLADGLVGGSLIGSAGKLPKQYMQAVFAGTSSSGVLVCILRIITKASLPHTPQGLRTSAHFYFIISTIILISCLVCCNMLYKLPVMQQHYKLLQEELPCPRPKILDTCRKIRWPGFGIFVIYTMTLSIFPGFLAENVESKLFGDWYPIMLITVYNFTDFIGKSLTAIYVLKSIRKSTFACIARLLFYPLFAACLHGPKWLKTEVPIVVLTLMLGLSNGYLTSVLMILSPKSVPPSEAEIVAVVMVVFLGIGLVSGSILGWFWII